MRNNLRPAGPRTRRGISKRAWTVGVAVLLTAAISVGTVAADSTDLHLGTLATLSPLQLVPANDPIVVNDPPPPASSNPPNLPPGTKYKLFGAAKNDTDPENAFNDVFSFDTSDPNAVAGAVKVFGDQVKVPMLDDQIELKYYYTGSPTHPLPRTCGGGSTRFQLGIDRDGDGQFDGNLFGYVGDKPFGGGCPSNQWVYEDMTDGAAKWDGSQLQLPCGQVCTWQQVETFMTSLYPNHRVLNEVLVDDSQSFFVADQGCAYFDLVSAGQRTYVRHDDASESGNLPNNC